MNSIAIVTDSTADIPHHLVDENQIGVVPAVLVIQGKSYIDGQNISRSEFYKNLPAYPTPPSTSSPSIAAFHDVYESLFQKGCQQVISVHVASNLSGIYNIACTAAKSFQERVKVIDSQQTSLGLGFQVLAAVEAVKKGLGFPGALDAIHQASGKIRLVALLDTMDYLRRSGRVGWATATLSSIFNIKPIIELKQGIVLRLGFTRLRKQGIDFLRNQLRELGTLERLAILHTGVENPREIENLVGEFGPVVSTDPLVVHVTTVIGTHVGPNGLGFVAVVR